MTKWIIAALIAASVCGAALTTEARSRTCYTNCYGNSCTTTCY